MNNHERYKRAFQALHAPEDSYLEAVNMNKQRERFCLSRRAAAVVLAAVLVVGGMTAHDPDEIFPFAVMRQPLKPVVDRPVVEAVGIGRIIPEYPESGDPGEIALPVVAEIDYILCQFHWQLHT